MVADGAELRAAPFTYHDHDAAGCFAPFGQAPRVSSSHLRCPGLALSQPYRTGPPRVPGRDEPSPVAASHPGLGVGTDHLGKIVSDQATASCQTVSCAVLSGGDSVRLPHMQAEVPERGTTLMTHQQTVRAHRQHPEPAEAVPITHLHGASVWGASRHEPRHRCLRVPSSAMDQDEVGALIALLGNRPPKTTPDAAREPPPVRMRAR